MANEQELRIKALAETIATDIKDLYSKTLSGGTLYNQATEPTGIGTQLPDTASFEANTDMMLYQSTINGVLRYFWVKL
ncbi:hypothetical protein [Algibacter sp. PT7-4]|uniref:hypothetical protein n=1 Tax=Algibacter ulvanivorans TaxID=3400999 RepID=UPI003AAD2BF9